MRLKWLTRFSLVDWFAFIALLMTTWFIAGTFLRDDVFILGDHAGHYWTLWYTLNVAVPAHHRIIDWIPYWYAGYPERLFYPPGTMIVGWALNTLTFGKFSTALIYASIIFIAYALPAFTLYYALRRLGFEARAAFAAGMFALGLPTFFDGAHAVVIGMTGSRLAFGLNALVLAWTIEWLATQRARYLCFAAPTLALAILLHPYHSIGLMLALGLYVLARRLPLARAFARIGVIVLGALALDAFWLAPMLAHSPSAMIPHLRATFDQTWRLLTDAALLPYALLALVALPRAFREHDATRRAVLLVLLMLPILLAAMMLGWSALVVERLRFYQLDPVRLIGEFYFALVLLAALGVSAGSEWLARRAPPRARGVLATLIVLCASVALLLPFAQTSAHFARADGEPRFLSRARREYRFDELWQALRAAPGRVWFTSFYTRLNAHGSESLPTTLASLTPLFAQRQILGGTFSHWSPIGALMWSGELAPPVLRGLPEEQDDRALFGVPIEKISDDQVYEYCRRFNITTIVASINDFRTRTFLDASPRFESYYNNSFFFVYRVKDYASAWVDPHNADVALLAFDDDAITLRVRAAQSDASVNVKVYAYPLWRARTDAGQVLPIARDDLALMRIALPPGENFTVTLRYEEGVVEQVGKLISMVSGVIFVSGVLGAVWRKTW